jgi:uncharacterized protein
MRFNVLQDLRRPVGSVSEIDLAEPELEVDSGRIHKLQGVVRLLRTDRGLLATVTAQGTVDAQCSRCLQDVTCPVEIDFSEEFVPVIDANTSASVRISEEDTFRIDARFELDLREAVRQYILMAEPPKPLCRSGCLGFCPGCGADLNAGPHDCERPADERWSALAGLRKDIDEGS